MMVRLILDCMPPNAWLLLSMVLTIGCAPAPEFSEHRKPNSAEADIGAASSGRLLPESSMPLEEISLSIGDETVLASWLDQLRGRVILVDFWATWCIPCVHQFPHTVSLSEHYGGDGLTVISVSMNEPDDVGNVREFLASRNARFNNLLTPYGAGTEFVEAFHLRGDIPFYRLYDRTGKLRFSFCADSTEMEDCEPLERMEERLIQLLAENQQ